MRFETVYVVLSASDAALSCLGRVRRDRAQNKQTSVLVLCEGTEVEGAAQRSASTEFTRVDLFPCADPGGEAAAEAILHYIRERAPETVVSGLGVRGDEASKRLCQSVLLAARRVPEAKNFLLYEERPESLLRGAVRARLAELGARIPQGASRSFRDAASPSGLLIAALATPFLRRSLGVRGAISWARSRGSVLRDLRSWNGQKSLGPRLQPLVEPMAPTGAEHLVALDQRTSPFATTRLGEAKSLRQRLLKNAAAAGADELVERYWLVLPLLAGEGSADPI